MNEIRSHIVNYAGIAGGFSAMELGEYLRSIQCEVPSASLYYHLDKLIQQQTLTRTARGVYSMTNVKPEFNIAVTEEMKSIYSLLHKSLPFADFCLYKGTELTSFQHNMAANNILYVETQRDTCDSAFNVLKDAERPVFVRPDREMINRYLSLADSYVFVKPLTSESPVDKYGDGMSVPTLEKLLVDINADDDFFYLHGDESFHIFRNAVERFRINEARLLRYARRRNLEPLIKKYLEETGI